ncbi:MAG: tetratricopeptide repeat protein [Pseudomonadota bacterium]
MDDKEVITLLNQRLNNDLNDIDAAINLGNYYFDKQSPAQAVLYYRAALDIDPSLTGVRTDMGVMYWQNGNLGLAEQAFREVIAQDPGFGQAYVNLGLLLHRAKNDLGEARSLWQQIVESDPNHAIAERARELLKETASAVN